MDRNESFYSEINYEQCPYNTTSNMTDIVLANNTLPSDLAVPLYGFALPIIVLVTTVANTLIVAVLAQTHMRTPTNILLIAISLSDLFTLLAPAPIFFYMYTLGNHEQPIFPISLCYTWYFFYDIIPNTFHTSSIWLTLALGIQRYVYVCHPPLARLHCNIPRVIKVIICIFISATLHQIVRFFEFRYEESCVLWHTTLVPACNIYYSKWIWSYLNVYYGTYFWFRVFFVHLAPCTILVVLNILLFKALRKAEMKRKKLLRENTRKKECMKLRDSNCTTMMLIVILTVFLITEIPLAVITLLHIFSSQGYISLFTSKDYIIIQKFFIASNFFITLSYPINFAIYCGMSRQFLETFYDTFFRHPLLCREKVSNVSQPTSHRSSVTAISFKIKHCSNDSTNQGTTGDLLITDVQSPDQLPIDTHDLKLLNTILRSRGGSTDRSVIDRLSLRSVSFAPGNTAVSMDEDSLIKGGGEIQGELEDQLLEEYSLARTANVEDRICGFHETVI